jgi:hypothetical protein
LQASATPALKDIGREETRPGDASFSLLARR